MWRQLSKVSTLVDYPANQQSFCNSWEDESSCWITSRACWCLFFCLPSRTAPGWASNPTSHHPRRASSPSTPLPGSDWQKQRLEFWSFVKVSNWRPRWFPFIWLCPSVRHWTTLLSLHLFSALTISLHLLRQYTGGSNTSSKSQGQADICMHAANSCGAKKKKKPNSEAPIIISHALCICKYKHKCMFNHKTTWCKDTAKHSHTHAVYILYTFTVSGLSSTHMCTATILNTKHCSLDYGAACATKMNILHFCWTSSSDN